MATNDPEFIANTIDELIAPNAPIRQFATNEPTTRGDA